MSDETQTDATASEAQEAPAADAPAAGFADNAAATSQEQPVDVPEAFRTPDGKPDLARIAETLKTIDTEGKPEGGYALDLAETVKFGDHQITIDKDHPALAEYLQRAEAEGYSQKRVTADLTLFARAQAAQMQAVAQQVDAEFAKLGADGPKRVEAAINVVTGLVGKDDASALLNDIRSERAFRALEAVIAKMNGADDDVRTNDISNPSQGKSLAERMYPN